MPRIPDIDDDSWTNPMVHHYGTADDRVITLCMIEGQRHWPDLCGRIGRPDLEHDPRFVDDEARAANAKACIDELERTFRRQPLAHWRTALRDATGVWSVHQQAGELLDDPQAVANAYVQEVGAAPPFRLVASPVQFDEAPRPLAAAPEVGQDTEAVLLDHDLGWDAITRAKDEGAIT
jgi:crotonobetainyl-CoA:carnitine CoA-transferase CaiB-like acyl-CoA transferase